MHELLQTRNIWLSFILFSQLDPYGKKKKLNMERKRCCQFVHSIDKDVTSKTLTWHYVCRRQKVRIPSIPGKGKT
jgi:hypothetical protein